MRELFNKLPCLKTFLGCLSLRIGSFFAAFMGIIHPAIFVSLYYNERIHNWATNTAGFMVVSLFLVSLVLLVGTILKRPDIIMIWIYFSVVFILTMVILMLVLAIQHIYHGRFWIGRMIGQILLYLFFVYLIIVVNSYARRLDCLCDESIEKEKEEDSYESASRSTQCSSRF